MKTIIYFLIGVFVLVLSTSISFAGGPWKGKIIDIETKEPIEGAVVLAVWERAYRSVSGDKTYFYEAKEVLTNKEGNFEIPAYTPINLLPIISYIRGPYFIIFKPGYLSLEEYIDENVIDKEVELQKFGKVYRLSPGIIELPKLKTRDERIKSQPSPVGDEKDWKKQKELIKALRQEWQYLYNEDPSDLYKTEEK